MTDDVMTTTTSGTMDDVPARDDLSNGPRTDQVRIFGAQRASGEAEPADGTDDRPPGDERVEGEDGSFGAEDWSVPSEPLLPHWTEAPTGEVPAILSRTSDAGDNPWAAVPEPSWREERADWDRGDPLDPAFLAGTSGGGPLGDVDESERQPWSFEIEGAAAAEEEVDEELFVSWDVGVDGGEGAPPSGPEALGWTEGTAGAPAEPFERTDEADLQEWRQDHTWDPDALAGERTSLMRLPPPPSPVEYEGAEAGGPPRHAGGVGAEGAAHDAALAEDLEARRGLRRWRRGREAGPPPPPPGGARPAGRNEPETRAAPVPSPVGAVPGRPGSAPGASAVATRVGPGTGARSSAHRRVDDVSSRTGRNMPAAIASGLAIGVLALVAFHFGTVPSMVIVSAVLGLAAVEAYAAFRRAGYHPATLLGLVAVVALIIASYVKAEAALPLITVLLVSFTFLWHLVGVDRRAEPVRSTAATVLVYCWIGVFGSFAALLLAPSLFPHRHGIAYLLGALISAVAYDVGALAVGAWLGRHPVTSVSPGKTWEGMLGGALAALVLAVGVVHLIHPWTLGEAVALGVVVAVVSPIGDLCESLIKRHLGLKDMGRILPGHGGVLDRVDGLLFVLPATFYLVRAFHGG
jgi:CDP-diglyceride synthetase